MKSLHPKTIRTFKFLIIFSYLILLMLFSAAAASG